MYRDALVLAVPVAALVLFAAASSVSGEDRIVMPEEWLVSPCLELHQLGDPATDRESCEADCRWRYSGVGGGGSPSGAPGYRLLAACIAECERQFWQRFDKKTRETE